MHMGTQRPKCRWSFAFCERVDSSRGGNRCLTQEKNMNSGEPPLSGLLSSAGCNQQRLGLDKRLKHGAGCGLHSTDQRLDAPRVP